MSRIQSLTNKANKHTIYSAFKKKYTNAKKRYSEYIDFKSLDQYNGFLRKVLRVYLWHCVHCWKSIIVHAFVRTNKQGLIARNLGDDLNKYLIERLTGMQVLFIPSGAQYLKSFSLPKRYIFIGSILSFFNLDNSVVWGAGIINPEETIVGKPKKVLSVRGPKTRQRLMEQKISCPECYGDPALLLPLIYKPIIKCKNTITVIIHLNTPKDNEIVNRMRSHGCQVICMYGYDCWTDVIDIIANSRFVISESLHGLIIAEAYSVPNVWVEFVQHFDQWSFKYQDYFESIDKYGMESIKLNENYSWESITDSVENWQRGNIDCSKMLKSFPLNIDRKWKVRGNE